MSVITGKSSVGATTEALSSNFILVYKSTAALTESSNKVVVYLTGGAATRKYRIVVYDGSMNLLGSSAEQTLTSGAAGQWYTVTLQAAVSYTASSVYYIGVWKESTGSEGTIQVDTGAPNGTERYDNVVYHATNDPENPLAGYTNSTNDASIYAQGVDATTAKDLTLTGAG